MGEGVGVAAAVNGEGCGVAFMAVGGRSGLGGHLGRWDIAGGWGVRRRGGVSRREALGPCGEVSSELCSG